MYWGKLDLISIQKGFSNFQSSSCELKSDLYTQMVIASHEQTRDDCFLSNPISPHTLHKTLPFYYIKNKTKNADILKSYRAYIAVKS